VVVVPLGGVEVVLVDIDDEVGVGVDFVDSERGHDVGATRIFSLRLLSYVVIEGAMN
jgi:hypothetical protein